MAKVRPLTELERYRGRQKPPLTRQDLAEQLGVSRITVYRWETGQRRPHKEHAPQLSELTGVPILELMGIAA